MPELPEVESLRRFLGDKTNGHTITAAHLRAFSALKTFDPPLDSIVGQQVTGTTRRGKHIGFEISNGSKLVIHLARGGWIRWQDEAKTTKAPVSKVRAGAKGPQALRLLFDDGGGFLVTEAGTEKRLAIWVVRELDEIENVATLGPDPLTVPAADIAELLRAQSGQVKKVLTDQRVIAGVGNAYSDEALHVARMSPFRNANKLTEEEAIRLASAVVEVLSDAVLRASELGASELKSDKKSHMRVHGRTGQKCPECGDIVREVSFATKSLQYCATCQTEGKPLADRRMSRLLK